MRGSVGVSWVDGFTGWVLGIVAVSWLVLLGRWVLLRRRQRSGTGQDARRATVDLAGGLAAGVVVVGMAGLGRGAELGRLSEWLLVLRTLLFPVGAVVWIVVARAARRLLPPVQLSTAQSSPQGVRRAPEPPPEQLEATRLRPGERAAWQETLRPLVPRGQLLWWLAVAVVLLGVQLTHREPGGWLAIGLFWCAWSVFLLVQVLDDSITLSVSRRGVRVAGWWGRDVREALPLALVSGARVLGRDEAWGRVRRYGHRAPGVVELRLVDGSQVLVGTRDARAVAALVNGLLHRESRTGATTAA
ncbi:hypothetical protein SAMN05445756_1128 [Kytococcus aerolatus]|uniref:PH domain-containing protein n=1 Tax=Kytococcus aerolatus TaxID=592308 RepID=A0A212TFB6_9MICO|nr:hypothetical protein SAMN05445756_1128 [Kytococcus aerolatus]